MTNPTRGSQFNSGHDNTSFSNNTAHTDGYNRQNSEVFVNGDSRYPEETRSRTRTSESRDFPPHNPLAVFLTEFLKNTVEFAYKVGEDFYQNTSVIIIATGLAGGIHQLASPYGSLANAAVNADFHGSVAVAAYVGLSFIIKTALNQVREKFNGNIEYRELKYQNASTLRPLINAHVVSYLTPMTLAWIVAYSLDLPVKYANATLYTLGTFGLMKILDKGYEFALAKFPNIESKNRSR